MKKLFFLAFLFFSVFIYADENNKFLELDMSEFAVISTYGIPNEQKIEPILPNHDWDRIIFEYRDLKISFYKVIGQINSIYTQDSSHTIKIDNFEIHCGQNKRVIESKFGKGSYDENTGNGAFSYYSLTDYREMEIMYDENNIVKSIYLGYVNPE